MSWLSSVGHAIDSGVRSIWTGFTGEKQWKQQAEYNTPANQMARYRQAGLNPNLIYGEGQAASAGNMSSAPGNYQGGIDAVMSLINMVKGVADVKNQTKQVDLDAAKTLAGIEHSKDVLEFEKKKMLIDTIFRTDEFSWNVGKDERDFNFKKEQASKDYALRWAQHELQKDEWNFKKDHYSTYGTYPGTTVDYLNMLFSQFLGKPVTDVMGDAGNMGNQVFATAFDTGMDVTNSPGFVRWIKSLWNGNGKGHMKSSFDRYGKKRR